MRVGLRLIRVQVELICGNLSSTVEIVIRAQRGDRGARRDRISSYVLALLFLDDKSRLCDLSKNDKSGYAIYRKIDKLSGLKQTGCTRTRILYSLKVPQIYNLHI